MDQRALGRLPNSIRRALQGKSRDEIEQGLIEMEAVLRPRELKAYTYTIFDLQQCFAERFAREAPEFLDPLRMDDVFLEALCGLQDDSAFWGGMDPGARLHDYLARYAVMYFDHAFETRSPAEDYIREFINRHRDYRPPASVAETMRDSAEVFAESRETLRRDDGPRPHATLPAPRAGAAPGQGRRPRTLPAAVGGVREADADQALIQNLRFGPDPALCGFCECSGRHAEPPK